MRIFLAIVMAIVPNLAVACDVQGVCAVRQRVVHHAAQRVVVNHHAQQLFNYGHGYNAQVVLKQVYPPQYYTVGALVQEDALANRLSQRIEKLVERKLAQALSKADHQDADRREHPGAALSKQRCAGCHNEGAQKVAEGKAPKLFDSLGQWIGTPDQSEKAIAAVSEGRMPPEPQEPLTDSDFVVFKDYLESLAK